MPKIQLYAAVLVCTLTTLAQAQTYTVNQTGLADFTSISDALAALTPDPDTGVPNIVRVTDSGVYEEVININVPVTLEATGTGKATIAVLPNINGVSSKGGVVVDLPSPDYTTGTVVLRNLNIIPAISTAGNYLMSAVEQKNANVYLELDRLIIAPNDGANQPLVTDGVTNKVTKLISTNAAFDPAIVQFGDDGVVAGRVGGTFAEGDGVELLLRDCVISHFRGDLIKPLTSTTPDCVNFGGGTWDTAKYRKLRVEGSGGYSYGRVGFYVFGDLKINGDPSDRPHIRGHSLTGVYLESSTDSTVSRDIDNVIIDGCSQYSVYDNGLGPVRYSMRNSICFFVGRSVVFTKKQPTTAVGGDNIFEDCTLVDARKGSTHCFRWESGNTMNIVMRNCILGGKFDYTTQTIALQANNVVYFDPSAGATLHISSSAVMTTGPFALRASAPFAATPTTTDRVIYADAKFQTSGSLLFNDNQPYYEQGQALATYDPRSADFLNVTNPDYIEAGDLDPTEGVTSASLSGGADYFGPSAAVQDWGVYDVGSEQYEDTLNQLVKSHDRRMKTGL